MSRSRASCAPPGKWRLPTGTKENRVWLRTVGIAVLAGVASLRGKSHVDPAAILVAGEVARVLRAVPHLPVDADQAPICSRAASRGAGKVSA